MPCWMNEAQAGVKIARRNINNLRYADDSNLMAESEEELKSLLMKVKEESEKAGLKLNIRKTRIMASGPICSVQFSHSVMSDSSRSHEPQHARPLCPLPTARVYPNLCPLCWWCHPTISSSVILFSSYLQSFAASGSFKWVSSSHQWPKYWSFSCSVSPSNEYSVLISFSMDWLDLLTVQGIFKSLLQHHSSKTLILRCSAFFMVQFSHPYMTTGKTIALTRRTFVGKVMSLLFNMLSRLVIAFLPRSKCLLISWLQSPAVVIWSPKK